MKVLVVSSFNNCRFAPFITEQVDALRKSGVECDYFGVVGRGIKGYLSNLPRLKRVIRQSRPDLIHAHYGLSGLLANMQRMVPVVTTYHGSDINDSKILPLSKISIRLSAHNIFVSRKCVDRAGVKSGYSIIPCGVDLSLFREMPFSEARSRLGWDEDSVKILFAGSFDDPVKNSPLAIEAVSLLQDAELVELKGYSRDEVPLLLSASNVLLMTSFSEGSPQVVKESLACGCPVVSVDVGDVKDVFAGSGFCFMAGGTPKELAESLKRALLSSRSFDGHSLVESAGMSLEDVVNHLKLLYLEIINRL